MQSIASREVPSSRRSVRRLPAPGRKATADILVVGTGPLGRATAGEVEAKRRGSRVIGHLSWHGEVAPTGLSAPLLGTSSELARWLAQHRVGEVYLAARAEQHGNELESAVLTCEALGVRFALPLVPFRLTRGCARHTRCKDGYIHYAPRRDQLLALSFERARNVVRQGMVRWLWAPLVLLRSVLALVVAPRIGPAS